MAKSHEAGIALGLASRRLAELNLTHPDSKDVDAQRSVVASLSAAFTAALEAEHAALIALRAPFEEGEEEEEGAALPVPPRLPVPGQPPRHPKKQGEAAPSVLFSGVGVSSHTHSNSGSAVSFSSGEGSSSALQRAVQQLEDEDSQDLDGLDLGELETDDEEEVVVVAPPLNPPPPADDDGPLFASHGGAPPPAKPASASERRAAAAAALFARLDGSSPAPPKGSGDALGDSLQEQDDIAGELTELVAALKRGSLALHSQLSSDNVALDSVAQAVDDNLGALSRTNTALKTQVEASGILASLASTFYVLFLAVLAFFGAYVVMRLFSKPPPLVVVGGGGSDGWGTQAGRWVMGLARDGVSRVAAARGAASAPPSPTPHPPPWRQRWVCRSRGSLRKGKREERSL